MRLPSAPQPGGRHKVRNKMIATGSKAPEFNLRDQNAKFVSLSSMRGKKVLLSFRPLAWTPV